MVPGYENPCADPAVVVLWDGDSFDGAVENVSLRQLHTALFGEIFAIARDALSHIVGPHYRCERA